MKVLGAAKKIQDDFSEGRKKALCREMERILTGRRQRAASYGDGHPGHRRAMKVWQDAIDILNNY